MDKQELVWEVKPFEALSLQELYKVLQLRQEVFVLEQACVYSDLDNKDQVSFHVMGWHGSTLAAYTRLIPYGVSYPDAVSIGRVVIPKGFRGKGLGEELMQRSIAAIRERYGLQTIKISAQHHLREFYGQLGFRQTSEPYLDAGILHIEMTR
ncbi:ElaA protein [Parapedobacter composti]|uniref:ElaA protein n=1 Tax=Parapedobacter composti TaxID=623281 RepID=A0A1I1FPN4_9SPHI|nr:GNAT family N-acetyltransferase [Parapedobacter composti]SFC01509.1 ElaA protein [Parapedobacter composti]